MMGISTKATPFNSWDAFDDTVRHFDESALPYPHHLLADPHRVSQVFKGLLAKDKIKLFVFKGPRLMRTKIPLHPALSGKVGGGPMIIKVESRLLFVVPGEKIQYIVGSTQRFTSAPDI